MKISKANTVLCVVLLLLVCTGNYHTVQDFDNADTWFDLFKAIFWLVLFAVTFWTLVHSLVTGKPIWRLWE